MIRTVPRIGLMLGDPSGIGPELVAKMIADPRNWEGSTPVVIGDRRALDRGFAQAKLSAPAMKAVSDPDEAVGEGLFLLDRRDSDPELPPLARVTPASGRMTLSDLRFCIELIRKGSLDGFVFAPLNKEALMRSGMQEHSELELFKNEFPHHQGLEIGRAHV
jgi:4-hydroxy-L-threonine phosphate dehydrogenase PdxA